ncbi:hypothetical protein HDU82_001463, partial [Entophlyctis luteolus]
MTAPVLNKYKVPVAASRAWATFTGGLLTNLVWSISRGPDSSDVVGLSVGILLSFAVFLEPIYLSIAIRICLPSDSYSDSAVAVATGGANIHNYKHDPDVEDCDDSSCVTDDGIRMVHLNGGKIEAKTLTRWMFPNFTTRMSWPEKWLRISLSALIVAISTIFLPDAISNALAFFTWISICTSVWSLIRLKSKNFVWEAVDRNIKPSGAPVDPNTFFSEDTLKIDEFTRPAFALILL